MLGRFSKVPVSGMRTESGTSNVVVRWSIDALRTFGRGNVLHRFSQSLGLRGRFDPSCWCTTRREISLFQLYLLDAILRFRLVYTAKQCVSHAFKPLHSIAAADRSAIPIGSSRSSGMDSVASLESSTGDAGSCPATAMSSSPSQS